MKKTSFIIIIVLCFFMAAQVSAAEDKIERLDAIVVTGDKILNPTKETDETVYTGTEITRDGIEIQGAKAAVSVYEAVNVLPGVNVEAVDPFGLGAEQKNMRVRGVRGYFGALTVDGVPNYGGNPMGPREYIYDTENFESIAVYKGAVPADLGTGVGARGGAVELRPRWPEEKLGLEVSQGIGANKYLRTFSRIDSGTIPKVKTRLSLSYSYTDAEKWKGPGDLGPRNNVAAMLVQPTVGKDSIKLWYNYNDLEQDLYMPLTYDETRELSANYKKDYNDVLAGNKKDDIHYYRYNSGDYKNHDFLSEIPVSFTDSFSMLLKPYYSKEDTEVLGGLASQGGIIQKRLRDIERYGILAGLKYDFSWLTASVGYWYEASNMVIRTESYDPVSFAFKGYGMYMDNEKYGTVNSPYFNFAGIIGDFDWQIGGKYFSYTDPASQGYIYSAATKSLEKAPDLFREEKDYNIFLPSVGLSYHLTKSFEFYASYGKNEIRPYAYMPLINLYNQNRARFQAAGVTLNDLFNGYGMELSDNYELGARFMGEWLDVMPAFFFNRQKDLLTTVYDPRVNLSYYQNIGKATGYGVELQTNLHLKDYLTFFVNPTYTSLTYDEDLTYQGNTMPTKDKQVVDTPEWMVKSGIILKYKGFEAVPMVRYLGKRYGDASHTESVGDYWVSDLKFGYSRKNLSFIKSLKVSLEFTNLFNEEYVAIVNAMDDTRAGSASYYVGAPFTTLFSVSLGI